MSYDFAVPNRQPAPKYNPWSIVGSFLILIGGAIVLAWALGWVGGWRGAVNDPDAVPRPVMARGDLAADEKSNIEIFKSASPSVVHITTVQYDRFSFDLTEIPAGSGSGFIWDEHGHVVTNAHVLVNASAAKVTLNDGTTLAAELSGAAKEFDLAVLKIDVPMGKRLPALPIGKSSDLVVGQRVYAIGNPFGLDQTLTTGIVSALGRQIRSLTNQRIEDAIQTDAAINPGNSGGPLLDSAGRLIGVTSQIVSPSGAYAGVGFAIPVDTVNKVVPELIRYGKITKPTIGVVFDDEFTARRRGVRSGALIRTVKPGGPAEKAGLRSLRPVMGNRVLGDVIIALDGKKVTSPNDFETMLSKKKAGDTVNLTVNRGGEEMEVEVTLEAG